MFDHEDFKLNGRYQVHRICGSKLQYFARKCFSYSSEALRVHLQTFSIINGSYAHFL
jgi:hypothetical protein